MKKKESEITLVEIRKAQSDIAAEISKGGVAPGLLPDLEKASFHLRNLERLLVASIEKSLLKTLKVETESLSKLTREMGARSKRLSGINEILRKIVKITGQIVDAVDVVK
jgi:hypothetical protein